MLSSPLARKSITDVARRKGRTLVVVLSIFIGVLGLTSINVFAFNVTDAFAHQQDRSHYPDITFSVARLDPALTTQIAALPNVQTVQEQMAGRFQWQTASGPIAINVTAFQDPQHVALGGFELTSGHYPGPGEIVMEMTDLTLHSFSLNGTIQLQGQKGITPLRVAGVVQTPGLPPVRGSRIARGYMRMSDLGQLLGTTQDNSISIKVRDIDAVQDTAQALRDLLQRQHLTMQNAVIESSANAQFGLDFINGFFNLVRVLAAGAIVVSCFLIMNTLTTLIAEQMRIIGTMKALGGTQSDILKSYLLTVLIYSLLGTFLGLALGITFGYAGAFSAGLLYIQARDHSPAALRQLANRIDQALQPVGNATSAVTKQDEFIADERSVLSICIIFYVAAVGVAMVGILGLYNTLTSSVLERQREIGIWRSMGASNWQVARTFWIEGLSLASLAWLVGAIVEVPIAYGFDLLVSRWLFPVPFAFDAGALPLMLLVLVIIATLASFGPTARASRARIATILRYE